MTKPKSYLLRAAGYNSNILHIPREQCDSPLCGCPIVGLLQRLAVPRDQLADYTICANCKAIEQSSHEDLELEG